MSAYAPGEPTIPVIATSVLLMKMFPIFSFTVRMLKASGACWASTRLPSPPLNGSGLLLSLGLLSPTRECAQPLSPVFCGMFGSAGTPRCLATSMTPTKSWSGAAPLIFGFGPTEHALLLADFA